MVAAVAHVIVKKLQVSNHLDAGDIAAIERLPMRRKDLDARQSIVSYGDKPSDCCVIIEGFVARSLTLPEGERQILSIHIPGEIPDIQSLHTSILDHDLRTLSPSVIGLVPHTALRELTEKRPNVAAALWRESLIDGAVFRQWIVNVGRRNGVERMSHLLAELRFRLEAVGKADGSMQLPFTQTDLADCLGLSAVHTNRVLQELRQVGLIETNRRQFKLLDIDRLEQIGQFDSLYLRSPR